MNSKSPKHPPVLSLLPALLLCTSLFLALSLALPLKAEASGPTGPRFSWSSFQRFWEKQASPLVYLTKAEPVAGGYLVDYGFSTTMRIPVQDRQVQGVEIRFLGGAGNDAGGPQFKRLVHQAINIGTYKWPEDKIDEVRRLFAVMSPQAKEYRYQMTYFRYNYAPDTGWSFSFHYVPDLDNPGGRARFPWEEQKN